MEKKERLRVYLNELEATSSREKSVWCGVVWCGVVGVVWCGVVWCGVWLVWLVWWSVVWCGVL